MRRLALIGFLALISSACTLDIDIGVELRPSGAGSVSINVVTDGEFEDLFALTGRQFEDLIATRGAELGLSFVVVPGDDPRYFAEAENVNRQTLIGILEGLAPGLGTFTIETVENTLELDGRLNALTEAEDAARYFEGTDPAPFADDVAVTVSVALPGTVESSTGNRSGDGDLTWEIPLTAAETRLFGRTILEEEGAAFPWPLAVGTLTLAIAVAFLVAVRARSQPEQALPRPVPSPASVPPEEQAVGPDARPPEEQAVAPPAEAAGS